MLSLRCLDSHVASPATFAAQWALHNKYTCLNEGTSKEFEPTIPRAVVLRLHTHRGYSVLACQCCRITSSSGLYGLASWLKSERVIFS